MGKAVGDVTSNAASDANAVSPADRVTVPKAGSESVNGKSTPADCQRVWELVSTTCKTVSTTTLCVWSASCRFIRFVSSGYGGVPGRMISSGDARGSFSISPPLISILGVPLSSFAASSSTSKRRLALSSLLVRESRQWP